MEDPLDPSDPLAAALRESRLAVADDGFSLRVAQRAMAARRQAAEAERRRARLARALPLFMALLGVTLAAAFTNLTALPLGNPLPPAIAPLSEAARGLAPLITLFARFGLPPWAVVTALAALLYALLSARQDPRAAFRF